jgi:hypothetical protein
VRRDKETPNAIGTYHKVMLSIFSAIDSDEIGKQFAWSYELGQDVYAKDIAQQAREQEAAHRQRNAERPLSERRVS